MENNRVADLDPIFEKKPDPDQAFEKKNRIRNFEKKPDPDPTLYN